MIYRTQTIETLENLHGGIGKVHISRKLTKDDSVIGIDMFAEVTIDRGASIGYHLHKTDAEAYYIVEGEGVFQESHDEKSVQQGDLCLITKDQGHGMKNTGDTPLRMIAIVWS